MAIMLRVVVSVSVVDLEGVRGVQEWYFGLVVVSSKVVKELGVLMRQG